MAVHQAMHELSFNRDVGPTPKAFATQVRRLGELELLLKRRMKQGDSQIESVGHAIALGVQEIGAAFDGFSRQLVQGELSTLVEVKDANALEQAFLQLKQVHISVPLQAMTDSVEPLKQWVCELQVASAPHLESLRAASALAGRVHSTVMVVDDEKFQFEFISKMLKDEPYRFVFASSGAEAMKMLRQVQPDVLLMDFKMPKMDGVEVLRWMKGSSRYVNIPIIMITSNSEESVVEACLKAGATDFMVKPLNRKALISKVANVLGLKTSPLPTQPPDIYESDV
jgi:CheY-like chemotaxis protein